MDELKSKISTIYDEITGVYKKLDIDGLKVKLNTLKKESLEDGFWNDNLHAQEIMKQISKLENRIQPWETLIKQANENKELIEIGDNDIQQELSSSLEKTESTFNKLKSVLKFSGPYDDHDAILSVHAGAGGTDAQDWAQMLLRMYTRWAEARGFSLKLIDESSGDEAGIKSASIEVEGEFVFGNLKNESGIHRLVRLSPFNSDNLRQTSFAKVEVIPRIDSPEEVLIDEKDIKIDVFRSGGHGGQSVNTTDSAVRVTHLPTGIVVAIQNERSQIQNKDTALTILRSKLAQLQIEQHAEKISELKGPNKSAEWGNQIRSYVLHPYKQVKDLRSKYETSDVDSVLDGKLDEIINANLEDNL